ncbi:MAG: GIY-YIG nuclease family protein, partial [Balneolaceae bacterium]
KSGRCYYGHCSDLQERLHEHNTGQSPYTKGKGPWRMVGYIESKSRAEAVRYELKLKNMKSPSRAVNWLSNRGVVR